MIACRQRTFERQLVDHIRVDQGRELFQLVRAQLRKIDAFLRGTPYGTRDDLDRKSVV